MRSTLLHPEFRKIREKIKISQKILTKRQRIKPFLNLFIVTYIFFIQFKTIQNAYNTILIRYIEFKNIW